MPPVLKYKKYLTDRFARRSLADLHALPDVNCLPVQGNLPIEPFRRFVRITKFNYHSTSREPDQNENLEATRWQVQAEPHEPTLQSPPPLSLFTKIDNIQYLTSPGSHRPSAKSLIITLGATAQPGGMHSPVICASPNSPSTPASISRYMEATATVTNPSKILFHLPHRHTPQHAQAEMSTTKMGNRLVICSRQVPGFFSHTTFFPVLLSSHQVVVHAE